MKEILVIDAVNFFVLSRMDQVKSFGRQPLKRPLCLGRPYHFKIFKDCLPQILLGPFLNTLTHIIQLAC